VLPWCYQILQRKHEAIGDVKTGRDGRSVPKHDSDVACERYMIAQWPGEERDVLCPEVGCGWETRRGTDTIGPMILVQKPRNSAFGTLRR